MKIRPHLIAFILGIIPFLFLSKMLFLVNPPVWPDEAVFTSTAKNFSDTGTIATTIYGKNDFKTDQGSFPYPPIYFWVLGTWGKLFGFSIESVRMLSISITLPTLLLFYGILIKLFKKPSIATVGLLLISTDIWFNRISRIGRMEILVSFFTGAAFYAFLVMQKRKRLRIRHIVFVSLFSTFAFLTHPVGILSTAIICALTLIAHMPRSEKIKLIFSIVMCLCIFTGIWLLTLGTIFPYFMQELRYAIFRKSTLTPYIWQLIVTSDAWRYIWLSHITLFLITLYQIYKRKKYPLVFFVIPVVLAYCFVYFGTEMWYIGYLQPWTTYLYLATLLSIRKRTLLYQLTIILAAIICLVNIIMFSTNAGVSDIIHSGGGNYAKFSNAINNEIPKNARILVSAIPDPTFILSNKRNTSDIFSFFIPPLNSQSNYKTMLDTIDVIVGNKFLEPMLPSYIRQNLSGNPVYIHSGGYSAYVYYLVPQNQRVYVPNKQ